MMEILDVIEIQKVCEYIEKMDDGSLVKHKSPGKKEWYIKVQYKNLTETIEIDRFAFERLRGLMREI